MEKILYTKGRTVRMKADCFKISEPWSAFTHFIALVASATAAPFLIARAFADGRSGMDIFGCAIFCISLMLLYGASTCYHTFDRKITDHSGLRKTDHMMIFILIAGTYTPMCISVIGGIQGGILFMAVWLLAIAGMLLKLFWVNCPKPLSSVLYIGLGWACVFVLPTVREHMGTLAFRCLLAGGIIYTAGGLMYAFHFRKFDEKHPDFGSHEIFHLFIMAGSFFHYLAVYFSM